MANFGDIVCLTKTALKQKKLKDTAYRFVRADNDIIIVQRCNVSAEPSSPERWFAEESLSVDQIALIIPARSSKPAILQQTA